MRSLPASGSTDFPWQRRNLLFRYGGAVASVGMALILDIWLTSVLRVGQPAALLLIAVGFTGLLLGLWPSVFASFLSVVVLDSIYRWAAIPIAEELVFLAEGIGLAMLVESQRRAHYRLRET